MNQTHAQVTVKSLDQQRVDFATAAIQALLTANVTAHHGETPTLPEIKHLAEVAWQMAGEMVRQKS